jgi:hypothetical protein
MFDRLRLRTMRAVALAALSAALSHRGAVREAEAVGREALTVALELSSQPIAFMGLASMATLISGADPDRARQVLATVLAHPALTTDVRRTATRELEKLSGGILPIPAAAAPVEDILELARNLLQELSLPRVPATSAEVLA